MIEIGKDIKILLDSICKKVFPVIADAGTTFPFITYRRSSSRDYDNKDSIYEESATVEIIVASNTYSESIDLAQKCREKLEGTKNKKIKKISLVDAFEDYQEDAFIQTLVFNIKLIK